MKRLFCAILSSMTGLILCLFGCTQKVQSNIEEPVSAAPAETAKAPQENTPAPTIEVAPAPSESAQPQQANLVGFADTLEEAEQIAAQYGVALVAYSYGVAGYYTDEDTQSVIQRGKDNGWPELHFNQEYHTFE